MSAYCVLDIETVSDLTVWTPPEPKKTVMVDLVGNPVGWTYDHMPPFPPVHSHRVVAWSCVFLSDDDGRYYHLDRYEAACSQDEKGLLEQITPILSQDSPLYVTWNGRSFDLPVLNLRSLKHGIQCNWYYSDKDVRYRYSEAGHCDLMDVFSDYGATRSISLDGACRLMGLPGKTGDFSGKDVEALLAGASGDERAHRLVEHYCLSDSVQTALLFIRSRYHKGMIDRNDYNSAVQSFLNSDDLMAIMSSAKTPISGSILLP